MAREERHLGLAIGGCTRTTRCVRLNGAVESLQGPTREAVKPATWVSQPAVRSSMPPTSPVRLQSGHRRLFHLPRRTDESTASPRSATIKTLVPAHAFGFGTLLPCCTRIKDSENYPMLVPYGSVTQRCRTTDAAPIPYAVAAAAAGPHPSARARWDAGDAARVVRWRLQNDSEIFLVFSRRTVGQGGPPLPPRRSSAERPTPVGSCGRVAGMRGAPSATTRAIAGGWGGWRRRTIIAPLEGVKEERSPRQPLVRQHPFDGGAEGWLSSDEGGEVCVHLAPQKRFARPTDLRSAPIAGPRPVAPDSPGSLSRGPPTSVHWAFPLSALSPPSASK